MSSDNAVSESNSAFSDSRLTTTYQTMAMTATVQVETSGVRKRGWMWANDRGMACRRAIDRPVRDAGMIVVWVEAMADVATASSSTHDHRPIALSASEPKMASSSLAFSAR